MRCAIIDVRVPKEIQTPNVLDTNALDGAIGTIFTNAAEILSGDDTR